MSTFETTDATTTQSPSNRDAILEIRDTRVSYQMSRGQARVLNDVNIDVYRGETLGIAGESGSGKSMLASALLDDVPDPGVLNGDITYYPDNADPVSVLELSKGDLKRIRWEEIAMVFQGAMSAFNPTVPIRSHFMDTLEAHNEDKEEGMERAREIMRDVHLDPERILDVKTYQHELSGGQRQRILLALSLLLEPEVLVLDEPTEALDLLAQRSLLRLLNRVEEEYDLTMVFITHDLPIISALADRIGVMYSFEFVEIGDAEDILYEPSHPYTRGLLRATPNLGTDIEAIETVEGSSPDPVNIPSGCAYHPRCPVADERCEIEDPDLIELEEGTGHRAACFYTDQAKDEIPVSIGSETGGDDE